MNLGSKSFFRITDQFVIGIIMLCFFVFSATVTGSLVFGYPLYLALNKDFKKAIAVVLYTLLFSLLLIGSIFFISFIS
jgi:hypothetical protein